MAKIKFKSNLFETIEIDLTKVINESKKPKVGLINEELTGADVKEVEKIFKTEFKNNFNKIEKMVGEVVAKELHGKENEKAILTITRNAIFSLFKNLWIRRDAIAGGIQNKRS